MSPHVEEGPPRLAEWLLRQVLPEGVVGDSIVGDAREEYAEYVRRSGVAAGAWYWIHAARLAVGYRIMGGGGSDMGMLWKDLKTGARALARMPGSAAISVVVLGIGIGLCSFMFSIIYGLYFRGMPVPEADRVVAVYETNAEREQFQRSIPMRDFLDFRERQGSFESLAATRGSTINLAGVDAPVRFQGALVTANTFSMLRVPPLLGRSFVEGDDAPGAPPNVVLSHRAWTDRYAGDPSLIGRDVRVNGEPATIIGVMPEGFEFPNNTELWIPLRDDAVAAGRATAYVSVFGRLAEGVTMEQAELDMASIARQIELEAPESNEGIGAQIDTIIEANMDENLNLIFGSMMFAVICVLLVACANVANLLLARAAMRTKEAGIRVAMGAGRLRVMTPFFAEAFVLSAAGAALGIGLAVVCVEWFDTVTDPSRTGRPWFMDFMVDWPIVGFVVALSVFTALVAGLAPAWKMSKADVNAVLKDESRGSSGLRVGRTTRVLVTAEVALSCALLVGAGLMTKSIVQVSSVQYPFETESVLTARVGLFQTDYPDAPARAAFWRDLMDEIRALPSVERASLSDAVPMMGAGTRSVALAGVAYDRTEDMPAVNRAKISEDFFSTFGAELVAGRLFSEADDLDSERVAIVNQSMVERYFEGRDPLGQQFHDGPSDTLPMLTVVGVAPDLRMTSAPPNFPGYEPAGYYVPLTQEDEDFIVLAARGRAGDARALTADLREAVRRVDTNLPIYSVFTEAEIIDRATWFFGVFGTVFIGFGLAALFMASVGLYGVLSFSVARRTQEMGIRMALGADARKVIGLIARQGATQLGVGLGIGLILAFALTRLVALLMYEVDPQDPVVFASVFAIIVFVGVGSAVFPAMRATSVSPVESLRAE